MAADEVLLESAAAGIASLRFYGWSEATLTLGYFQSEKVRHTEKSLAQLPYVRRPTGGASLVHQYEVTYALALPAGRPWQTGEPWLQQMHAIIAAALSELQVAVRMPTTDESVALTGVLCFKHVTAGDLLITSAKIVGSAQRRQRGTLLQHGAILLACSPHTPQLPGIRELSNRILLPAEVVTAVTKEVCGRVGWNLFAEDWTTTERRHIDELVARKYTRESWNCKR
jgi:lipoate-protein ligase A